MALSLGRWSAVLALILVIATSAGARAQTNGSLVPLKVAVVPIVDVAPFYLGLKAGFFKNEGLDVQPVVMRTGSDIVAALVAGDVQIGFSNMTSLISAFAHGLPVEAVIAGAQVDGGGRTAGVYVSNDSPIRTIADLRGKTIAVSQLNSLASTTIYSVLERAGLQPTQVKLVELAFSEMPGALRQGRVDAIAVNEPFLSVAVADGDRFLFNYFREFDPNLTIAAYFATPEFMQQNVDTTNRFRRALALSLNYAAAHPQEAREMLSTYTKLDPATIGSIAMTGWSSATNVASVRRLTQAMVRYKQLPHDVDLSQLFPPQAVAGR
jgi:NitT/TauT family transport system substrate-binding protein